MERFKVHDFQLLSINSRLKLAKGDAEGDLCRHYEIERLDQLNATDYDEIIELIYEYIRKERQWNPL